MTKQQQLTHSEAVQELTKRITRRLVGRTIVSVAFLSDQEADELGWSLRPIVLTLNDGCYLLPMSDGEGNDGGALATGHDDLPTISPWRTLTG